MYLDSYVEGDALVSCAMMRRPMGPGFSKDVVAQADRLEVWCTGILDSGPEFVKFDLLRRGKLVASIVVPGH